MGNGEFFGSGFRNGFPAERNAAERGKNWFFIVD
jgi:hypothetical protein